MTYPAPPPPYNVNTTAAPAPTPATEGWIGNQRLANWPRRTLATLIDLAATVYLPSLIAPNEAAWEVLTLLLVGLNSVYLQSRTYQSLGKLTMGLFLARPVLVDNNMFLARPSYGHCAARLVLHVADLAFFFIGFLRPAWHWRRQTFADSLTRTVVAVGPRPIPYRAPSGVRNLA